MNPKLYFKISESVLIPMEGQSNVLDAYFKSLRVKKNNEKIYNEYTKNFISEHQNEKNQIYSSDDYSYDNILNAFNFGKIEILPKSEKPNIEPNFDHTKSYNMISEPKVEKSEKTQTIEKPKNFLEEIKLKYPKPSIKACGMHIDDFVWNYLVRNILKHQNTLLVGPTGTGKTEMIMAIAKTLNMECHVCDFGSMQDPLTDLLGSHRLENGSSIFDYAAFTEYIQKPCIIVLDELSRAPLMANNILFPCLDSRRELPIEIADSKSSRRIKVHPECVFIATANIGLEYSGTNDLDAALFNRFLPLQLNYLSPKDEIEVLVNRTGIKISDAKKIVNFANRIREEYNDEILSKSCSTRETLAIAGLVADGFTHVEAYNYVIIHKYHNPNDEECGIINRIMISL